MRRHPAASNLEFFDKKGAMVQITAMAKRSRQQEFQDKAFKKPDPCFGGSLLKGNPKGKRPLDSKLPIHLTLRATMSVLKLRTTYGKVNRIVYDSAKRHGVQIYKYANVGNHLHILIKIPRIGRWAAFIRELTGRIAQEISKAALAEA